MNLGGGQVRALAVCVVAALAGCGSAKPAATEAPAAVERPRDTAQIAEEISGGRVGALLYMDRLRSSPLGAKLDETFRWRAWWEGTGLDPERDIARVFASAPSLEHPERGIWVTEMNIPLDRVRHGLDVMFQKERLKGAWIEGTKRPEAKIELNDGSTRLVALVEPRFVVMLPQDREKDLARFETSGGFPDPIGAEALVLFAFDPSKTLHGRRASLEVPSSIGVGVATVTLTVDGGAEIGVDALSKDREQARRDAAELTRLLDEATSIKISSLRVHFVDPITFRADGDHVRGRRTVPATEIAQLLAFARPRRGPKTAAADRQPDAPPDAPPATPGKDIARP